MEEPPQLPPAPPVEHCYRHPAEQTRVHCTRCGRPICPACMIAAPVGHQCPQCVEEARREFRQGPIRRARAVAATPVTRVLMALIVGVFVLESAVGGPGALFNGPSERQLFDLGALQPCAIALDGQYWRLFTAMFLHAGIWHIAVNAYALWLLGTAIESAFGRARFLAVFLVTGLLASVASYAFGPIESIGVGASGAIFGVFGAFIAYNFRRRHLARAAAALRWALSMIALNVVLALAIPGIDLRAHAGGLVAGLAAGALADEIGPRRYRPLIRALGFAGLVLLGLALVAWRTPEARAGCLPIFS